MKKKLLALFVVGMAISSLTLSAGATTSQLDVKKGDTYSYWTMKDSGSKWDNYFYVKPTSYGGANAIFARSYAQDGSVSSDYQQMSRSAARYSYGKKALGGKMYRLQAYGSPDSYSWHLVGKYTP